MTKIIKNLGPYWKSVVLIFLLLIGQAYCDLTMPQITSYIIDVGIQNSGVEHIVPEKITADEYGEAQVFMTDGEKETWSEIYDKDGDIYVLNVTDEEKLDELDEELLTSIVMTYQLGHMSVEQFRETVKSAVSADPALAPYASEIDDMSVEEMGQLIHMDVKTFEAEDEEGEITTYVDMRPIMARLIDSGMMSEESLDDSRASMEETVEKIGSETLSSMGIAYARDCMSAAGMDVDDVQMSYLWSTGFKLFVLALAMLAVGIAVAYLASGVGAGVGRDLRSKVFRNVMSYSNTEMDKFSTASLITRSTNDIQQVVMVTIMILRLVLYAPIMGVGGIYKVYHTGADMGWIIALGVLVLVGFILVLVAVAMPKFKVMQKMVDALNLVAREILTGLSVIRAFGREKTEEARFDKANTDLKKTQLFTNRVMTFMMPGMMLIMYCLILGITWVSAHEIDDGTLQVGAMTAFITYSMQIVMSFLMLTAMSIMLPRAGVAAERIDEVLRTKSSIENPEKPAVIESPKGEVTFNGVSFKYPGADDDCIHDISFTAKPGQTTAIIGSTGAGKSTLINLLPRFYDVTGGEILIDGVDVRDMDIKALRDEIGFVPQKGVLFSGTIASNIRFGNHDASDAEVEKAAEIAQAADFVEEKDDKYDSFVAQGGSNVSGGQKQRLAIARAIAKNPKIYVFDDSFSALDMKTDAALRKALADNVKNSTVIIVAQRISTILHADQILVLDDGEIAGKGTHEELLRTCDTYRQIARSQLSDEELGIEEGKEEGSDE